MSYPSHIFKQLLTTSIYLSWPYENHNSEPWHNYSDVVYLLQSSLLHSCSSLSIESPTGATFWALLPGQQQVVREVQRLLLVELKVFRLWQSTPGNGRPESPTNLHLWNGCVTVCLKSLAIFTCHVIFVQESGISFWIQDTFFCRCQWCMFDSVCSNFCNVVYPKSKPESRMRGWVDGRLSSLGGFLSHRGTTTKSSIFGGDFPLKTIHFGVPPWRAGNLHWMKQNETRPDNPRSAAERLVERPLTVQANCCLEHVGKTMKNIPKKKLEVMPCGGFLKCHGTIFGWRFSMKSTIQRASGGPRGPRMPPAPWPASRNSRDRDARCPVGSLETSLTGRKWCTSPSWNWK